MANITDKTNLNGHVDLTDGKLNWISQINAGGTVYDIATHHSITFKEGNGGAATVWNGLTDIEVVIPSIADIVQTPVEFVGTVGADGKIIWVNGHSEPAVAGNLVFITADCTFAEKACEAGDMAIYDGAKWNVVSGENQVQLVGTTDENNRITVAVGSSKDVLTVEGKTLALTLDYAALNSHVKPTPGEVETFTEKIKVDEKYLKLTQGDSTPTTIAKETIIKKATGVKNDTVNLTNADTLVKSVTFGELSGGEFPEYSKNAETTFSVTGGSLTKTTKQTTGDYVDSVELGNVKFETAASGEAGSINMLTSIAPAEGTEFLTDIHVTKEGETADLTIGGYIAPTDGVNVKFVKGLTDDLTPVTSITSGNFELVDGSSLATGFGSAVEGKGGDVLSDVTLSTSTADVLGSATVTDHVLSFGSATVTDSVSVNYQSKSLQKTGFKYTAPVATNTSFITSGFEQVADVKYTFGKDKETTYTTTSADWKIGTPELKVTMGSVDFSGTGMVATVPSNTFYNAKTSNGTFPSLIDGEVETVKVTGTISKELDYEDVVINTVADSAKSINLPGGYSITTVASADADTVTVGSAGEISIKGTVDLSSYITGIKFE